MPLGLPAASLPGHPTTGPLGPETQLLGELTPGAGEAEAGPEPFPTTSSSDVSGAVAGEVFSTSPRDRHVGRGWSYCPLERWDAQPRPAAGSRVCVCGCGGGPWNGGAGQVGRGHLTVECTLGSVSRSSCRLRRLRGGRAERGADRASPRFGERAPAAAGAPGAASSLTPAAPLVSAAHSRA